jgi:hypothetical protein
LAEILQKNRGSTNLAHFLLNRASDFAGLAKYVVSLFKIAVDLQGYCCRWETVEFRDEILLQQTLLQAFLESPNLHEVVRILPFNDIRSLLLVSTPQFRKGLFLLLLQLCDAVPDYFKVSP